MAQFTVKETEYNDLKLTYKGIKYLNTIAGGAFEVVAKSMQGDVDLFPHIIYAALMGQESKISLRDVEAAIEDALENEKLDLLDVLRLSNELVTESFFYKATVTKLLADQKEAQKALKALLN